MLRISKEAMQALTVEDVAPTTIDVLEKFSNKDKNTHCTVRKSWRLAKITIPKRKT